MIYFVDASGGLARCVPERVYQGSTEGNKVLLVAPLAESAEVYAAFTLADGSVTKRYRLDYAGAIDGLTDDEGHGIRAWSLRLPVAVTAHYGTVRVQFYLYGAGNEQTASASCLFTVERGVPSKLPEAPEQDVYQSIVAALTAIRADLSNGFFSSRSVYAWNASYTYGANEIIFYPAIGENGAFVQSVQAGNTNHVPYADGAIDSAWWKEVVNFDNIKQEYFGDLNGILLQAQSAQRGAEAAEGSAKSAESAAADSADAAAESAESAQANAAVSAVSESNAKASEEAAKVSENNAKSAESAAAVSAQAAQVSAQESAASAELARRCAEIGIQPNADYASIDDLPRPGSTKFIYMIPNGNTEPADSYSEYLWVPDKNDYEFIGSTEIDLSGYAKQNGEYPNMTVGGLSYSKFGATSTGEYTDCYVEICNVAFKTNWGNASIILLVNGYMPYTTQRSGIIEIDLRAASNIWTVKLAKVLSGNLEADRLSIYSDENNVIHVYLHVQKEVFAITKLSALYDGVNITYPNTIISTLPDGVISGNNFNIARYDSDGNIISDVYAKQNGTYSGMTVGNANSALSAISDSQGNVISSTYAKQNGSYPGMTVGNAGQDGNGNNIVNTYATKTALEEGLQRLYPVGSIYFSTESTNPASLFGFGTWQAWGAGRVPVGVDSAQAEFDAAEKTGGEKTHVLTTGEMPTHTHFIEYYSSTESVDDAQYAFGAGAIVQANEVGVDTDNFSSLCNTNTGGGQPHNNLQPYITCYMWKRTA